MFFSSFENNIQFHETFVKPFRNEKIEQGVLSVKFAIIFTELRNNWQFSPA